MKPCLLILACSIGFLSCKKSSDTPTKTDQITKSDWKYDNGGVSDANGNIIVDFSTTGTIPACSLDNTIHFNADGTGTVYENANICQGASATTPFTWSFASNETVLNLSAGAISGIGGSFQVKEISATKLSLLKDTTYMGTQVKAVVNLKH